jgi:hypothetical protein
MRVAIVLALVSACRIQAAFECDFDEQCRDGDTLGTCQLEKFCSFPDDGCASGQRFADNAGDGLAGTCIGEAPIPDDSGIDAAPFDISLCPKSYNRELGPDVASKYRLITSRANVWAQAAACKADLPGATHLVVIGNTAEMDALRADLPLFPPLTAFVGVVQDPAAQGAAGGWIHFDGRAVSGLWTGPEPDNQQMPEASFHANVAILSTGLGTGLEDTQGTQTQGAFCECDGNPVHPMAQAFLDGDPSKP